MTRPFKILGVQQIAIGGTDKQKLKTLWVDLLGFQYKDTFVSERENVDEDICAIGKGAHEIEVDLMQPLDIDKKPAVHQTPLNHIGLWVDDLPKAVNWLTEQGLRFAPGGIRPGAGGHASNVRDFFRARTKTGRGRHCFFRRASPPAAHSSGARRCV